MVVSGGLCTLFRPSVNRTHTFDINTNRCFIDAMADIWATGFIINTAHM